MFHHRDRELEALRLLEFLVRSLTSEDLGNLFGTRVRKVCFRAFQVYAVLDRKTGEFVHDNLRISAVQRRKTALVFPGGFLVAKRARGWQVYDPRSHCYYPGYYSKEPISDEKLSLPMFFLERNGYLVLMNGLTGGQRSFEGRIKGVMSPIHILLKKAVEQWLCDIQTMRSVRVANYVKLTPRFDMFWSGTKRCLLDGYTGKTYKFDDIRVSDAKLSRYDLIVDGEVVGYVEGTVRTMAHPAHPVRPNVRH